MVKLISGEEVLCDIETNDETSTLKMPIMLVMQRDDDGRPLGLGMQPWLMLAQEEKPQIVINNNKIVFEYVPRSEIVNQYNEATRSIVTAPANSLDSKGELVL